ncbi:MAG: bacterioferritin-associated ferredoxin [Rhodoblastus sp.]
MIVCSCNRISDRDIDACATQRKTVAGTFRTLGCAPQCGRCAITINQILKAASAGDCDECIPGRCDCMEQSATEAA